MDVMAPMTTSDRAGDLMTRRQVAAVTSEYTLKIEAARAGVGVEEYQARLRQGLLWCYRCQDWHQAEAFPADARRHSGRSGSCRQALRAAAHAALAARGQLPPPAAVWVIRRPGHALRVLPGGQPWAYWRGPGRTVPGPGRHGDMGTGTRRRRRPVPRRRPSARHAHQRVRRGQRSPAGLPPGTAGLAHDSGAGRHRHRSGPAQNALNVPRGACPGSRTDQDAGRVLASALRAPDARRFLGRPVPEAADSGTRGSVTAAAMSRGRRRGAHHEGETGPRPDARRPRGRSSWPGRGRLR